MKFPKTYVGCSLLMACWIGFLYGQIPFKFKDLNSEAVHSFLAVRYAQDSHENMFNYFESSPKFDTYKKEDPYNAYATYRKWFSFSYNAVVCPIASILYVPFTKTVRPEIILCLSMFFALSTILMTWLLVGRFVGPWAGLFSAWLMSTNLIWLIHTKTAYPNHMLSAFLVAIMAFFLFCYVERENLWSFCLACFAGGIVFVTGWVGVWFVPVMLFPAVLLVSKNKKEAIIVDIVHGVLFGLFAIILVGFIFCQLFHCSLIQFFCGLTLPALDRFSENPVSGWAPGLREKIQYTCISLFLNGKQVDHLDKCLEGYPAIPVLFTALFFSGLFFIRKTWSKVSWLIVAWIAAGTFLVLWLYIYAHRYLLLFMPVMALIAANGLFCLLDRVRQWLHLPLLVLLLLVMSWTSINTYTNFYHTYRDHKPADFEVDRMRGIYEFSQWLKTKDTRNTLIVIGHPLVTSSVSFLFYTFDKPLPYVYLSNYSDKISKPQEMIDLADKWLQTYDSVMFVFADTGFQKVNKTSDLVLFWKAYPDLKSCFSYEYDNRGVLLVAYMVEKRTQLSQD